MVIFHCYVSSPEGTHIWGFLQLGDPQKPWLSKGLILDDLGYPHFWKGYVGGVGSTTKWWLSLFSSSLVILWWHMCLFVWYVSFWFILRILSSFLYPYSVHSPEKAPLGSLGGCIPVSAWGYGYRPWDAHPALVRVEGKLYQLPATVWMQEIAALSGTGTSQSLHVRSSFGTVPVLDVVWCTMRLKYVGIKHDGWQSRKSLIGDVSGIGKVAQ